MSSQIAPADLRTGCPLKGHHFAVFLGPRLAHVRFLIAFQTFRRNPSLCFQVLGFTSNSVWVRNPWKTKDAVKYALGASVVLFLFPKGPGAKGDSNREPIF